MFGIPPLDDKDKGLLARELAKHGVWAVLFTALLAWVLTQNARREQALMTFVNRTTPALTEIIHTQADHTDKLDRIETRVDRLSGLRN
jgi:hypothetical protein